jgi:hypothetical protein
MAFQHNRELMFHYWWISFPCFFRCKRIQGGVETATSTNQRTKLLLEMEYQDLQGKNAGEFVFQETEIARIHFKGRNSTMSRM